MSDPRDGFEVERIFTEAEYPYDAGGAYWKGLWVTSDGSRLYSAPDYFAATTARGYLPTKDSGGTTITMPFLGFRNEVAWAGTSYGLTSALFWSDDLDTWSEVDFDLSDLSDALAEYDARFVIGAPFYHPQSGRYFAFVGVWRQEGPSGNLCWLAGRIASATSPGATWTLGPEVFAAPPEATGRIEFHADGYFYDRFVHLTDSGQIVVIQATAWEMPYYDYPNPPVYPNTLYYADVARVASSPTALFTTTTTLAKFTLDSTGVIPGFVTVSDVTGGYAVFPGYLGYNLHYQGGLWNIGFYEFVVSAWASDLAGPWNTPSLPTGLVPPARWAYGDGVWLVHGLDSSGNAVARAGDSIDTATEPVEWEVAGPLIRIDAWYSDDGEWRGYCYPDDEDGWPDYWLIASGGGGWGISLS